MRVPSQPRRAGARKKRIHFQYTPTGKGEQWEAYVAAATWWGPLHMTKPSKPCVWELTDGAVPCRFCNGPRAVAVQKGWVPLIRRVDNEACCVPVDEAMRAVVDAIEVGTKVVVSRARTKGSSVSIRPALSQEPKCDRGMMEELRDADVTESLLVMWEVAELTTFFATKPSDNAVSLAKGANPAPTPGAPAAASKDAAQRYAGPDRMGTARLVGDPVTQLLQHAQEVGTLKNGKHD